MTANEFLNRKETDGMIEKGAAVRASESRVALESLALPAEALKIIDRHIRDAWDAAFRRGVVEYLAFEFAQTAVPNKSGRQPMPMIQGSQLQGMPIRPMEPSPTSIRIECLKMAGGDIDKAAAMESFVNKGR